MIPMQKILAETVLIIFKTFPQEHCTLSYLATGPNEGKLFTQVRKLLMKKIINYQIIIKNY